MQLEMPSPPGGMGLGKPLKLLAKPVSERIPIYLGAVGPKAIVQTGEIADGWLPGFINPDEPAVPLLDPLAREGLREGRPLDRGHRRRARARRGGRRRPV